MSDLKDPILRIWDSLPETDHRHNKQIHCVVCNKLIHDFHNEDYNFWIDTKYGELCVECVGFDNYEPFFKLQETISNLKQKQKR